MKRRTVTAIVEIEIPADVDIFAIGVRSLSLFAGARTIVARPNGVAAYLRPHPPEARVTRADLYASRDDAVAELTAVQS